MSVLIITNPSEYEFVLHVQTEIGGDCCIGMHFFPPAGSLDEEFLSIHNFTSLKR